MRKQYQIAEVAQGRIQKLADVDTKQIIHITEHPKLKNLGQALRFGFISDMWQENPRNPQIFWLNTMCLDAEPYDMIVDITGEGRYPGMDRGSRIIMTLDEDWFTEITCARAMGFMGEPTPYARIF